jgi:hypothetical protein
LEGRVGQLKGRLGELNEGTGRKLAVYKEQLLKLATQVDLIKQAREAQSSQYKKELIALQTGVNEMIKEEQKAREEAETRLRSLLEEKTVQIK